MSRGTGSSVFVRGSRSTRYDSDMFGTAAYLRRTGTKRVFLAGASMGGADGVAHEPAWRIVVALVGYTPDRFIVRNSWGTTWGENGFGYASSAYAQAAFTESYGVVAIEMTPVRPSHTFGPAVVWTR